jgi:hypothetical protein
MQIAQQIDHLKDVDALVAPTNMVAADDRQCSESAREPSRSATRCRSTCSDPAISGRAASRRGLRSAAGHRPAAGRGTLLALAHAYEQATDWHRREPPIA